MSNGESHQVRGPHEITIKRSVRRELDRLPSSLWRRVSAAIHALEWEPRPRGCAKLKGHERYRIRVGAYRILYSVDDSRRVVEIVGVGHRREVYRGL